MRLVGDTFKAKYDGGICTVCQGKLCKGEMQVYLRPNEINETRVHHDCMSEMIDAYTTSQEPRARQADLIDALAAIIETYRQS